MRNKYDRYILLYQARLTLKLETPICRCIGVPGTPSTRVLFFIPVNCGAKGESIKETHAVRVSVLKGIGYRVR